MEWGYLLGALALSTVFYWMGWGVVNFFREEGKPKKYFLTALKRLFSKQHPTGVERWFLAEQLAAVVILFVFSTVVFYRYWSTNGQLDLTQPTWIPFSVLLGLSFICAVPLMFWSVRVVGVIASFAGGSFDIG